MKKAFKGFDKDLKCRTTQFTIGEIHSLPEKEFSPRLCTNDGFHYCNTLEDVYTYYSDNGINRFCEIEVLGKFTEDTSKGITTSFKILREISEKERLELRVDEAMNLELVRKIQTKYPLTHVGGSVGLFLHGIRLSRFGDYQKSDLDMITPYYVMMEAPDGSEMERISGKKSSNDFDDSWIIDGIKLDFRIDPYQRYEIVEYKGFKYKVSIFETIMAAKMKYAVLGQHKHKDDIREMCGVTKYKEGPFNAEKLPF